MKRFLIFLAFCGLAALSFSSYTSGPGAAASMERTGVTGPSGCGGATCHGTASSPFLSGDVQVLDSATMLPVSYYIPLKTYYFRVWAVNSSPSPLPSFGYQLTAMKGAPAVNAGQLYGLAGSHVATVTGVHVAEHSAPIGSLGSAGFSYQVDVKWKAPAPYSGDVTVRAMACAVDGSGAADAADIWSACGDPLVLPEGPTPITGLTNICLGSSSALSSIATGGTWSSSNTMVATVGTGGVVHGVSLGTATISYVTTVGTATTVVTVHPVPGPISAPPSMCPGETATLSCSPPGGFWLSTSPGIVTVDMASGVVTAVGGGYGTVDYVIEFGCHSSAMIYVPASPIGGSPIVCVGSSTTLTHSSAGGTWASMNPAVATISSVGVVSGITAGTSVVSYTPSAAGICPVAIIVTVQAAPVATITGPAMVCATDSIALTGAPSGGTWTSSDPGIAWADATGGTVAGVAAGTATISYSASNMCGTDTRVFVVTVADAAPITGVSALCSGTTITLSHPTVGGTWTTSSTAVALVSSAGAVTGAGAGTSTISYLLGTCSRAHVVTVSTPPVVALAGAPTVCETDTVTLTATPAGGVWTSSATGVATVNPVTGVVAGIAMGAADIKYVVSNVCGADSSTHGIVVIPATICVAGSANAVAQTNELQLFPNPNHGVFSLKILATVHEEAHVVVTNVLGARIKEYTLATNRMHELSLNQPAGIYFLAVSTLSNKYFVKVVVE